MSIKVDLSNLSLDIKNKITKDLNIEIDNRIRVYPFRVKDDHVYLPFNYGTLILKGYPNDLLQYQSSSSYVFVQDLRDYQKEITREAIDYLNKMRCTFLALHTGAGKTFCAIYLAY